MNVATARGRMRSEEVLTRHALNRAALERQGLLRRWTIPVSEAIERLIGLQSQLPDPPYIGLWTRLEGFRRDTLTWELYARQVVRSTMMRYTLHLVTARDVLWLCPTLQPVLELAQRGFFGQYTAGMDLTELVAFGRALFEERPLTPIELRERLGERWPDRDARPGLLGEVPASAGAYPAWRHLGAERLIPLRPARVLAWPPIGVRP